MFELYREMENSLFEVSKQVGCTVRILSMSGSPAAEAYLSATRAIAALRQAWLLHLEIERVLFPRMICRNLLSGEFLGRVIESNREVETQLAAILSAPWPRSPQAGLQSLRTGVRGILTPLRAQIERERALILPVIPRLDRKVAEIAELVAS